VGGTVVIQADATDAGGIDRVEFYVDGALTCTDMAASYTCSWDTTTATDGSHNLQTKAYDPAGNMGTSTVVSVSVSNAAPSPELVLNGGFENGSSPWILAGAAARATGGSAHTGTAYAILGNGDNATGTVSQSVAIPAAAQGAYSFWLGVGTSERGKFGDFLYVGVIRGPAPRPLRRSPTPTARSLTSRRASTSPPGAADRHAGLPRDRNASRPTTFYVDDVSLSSTTVVLCLVPSSEAGGPARVARPFVCDRVVEAGTSRPGRLGTECRKDQSGPRRPGFPQRWQAKGLI
jgi:hypothetical protein